VPGHQPVPLFRIQKGCYSRHASIPTVRRSTVRINRRAQGRISLVDRACRSTLPAKRFARGTEAAASLNAACVAAASCYLMTA